MTPLRRITARGNRIADVIVGVIEVVAEFHRE
jgi:hypothetical protein